MKKLFKVLLAAAVIFGFSASTLSADVKKGQKVYIKGLKDVCGFNGAGMATKHSQDEWTEIYEGGKLEDELIKFCPKLEKGNKWTSKKFIEDLYDFFYEYANDSGNVPSC